MIKKLFYLVGAAAIVVVAIRMQTNYNQMVHEQSMTPAEAQAHALAKNPGSLQPNSANQSDDDMSPTTAGQPVGDVTEMALDQAANKAAALAKRFKETGDPMVLRVLDKPFPKGKRDLMANLTDFKEPLLPKLNNTPDSDVKTIFRGFYEAEPGKYRRIEFNRTQAIFLGVEDLNNRFPMWQEAKDDFVVHNYNEDPYSVVMTLRDMRVIYLKFYTGRKIPDYTDPSFRVMSGWIIDGAGERKARKVALIDGRKAELADTRTPGQYVWPRIGTIQMLMPPSELGD